MEQGSYEWYKIRLGKITGTGMKRVLGGPRAWASYAKQLRDELARLARIEAGEEIELGSTFDCAAMDWGRKWEPVAIAEYEFKEDVDVKRVGFSVHPDFPFIGCSLDGEVYKDAHEKDPSTGETIITSMLEGIVEAKNPYSESVHLRTLTFNRVPDEHRPQIHTGIWVADVDWGDFISYDPRRDLARRLFVRRLDRDDVYIERMERRCQEFWEFVQSGQGEVGQIKSDHIRSNTIPKIF